MALLQSLFIYPAVMGFVLVSHNFVTSSGVIVIALKNIYNGLLIDQNVRK